LASVVSEKLAVDRAPVCTGGAPNKMYCKGFVTAGVFEPGSTVFTGFPSTVKVTFPSGGKPPLEVFIVALKFAP
jgi:hypothetical protein